LRTNFATLILTATTVVLITFFPSGAAEPACDSIVIADTAYAIPEIWCDQRVDSTELADPARLARLPSEYCHEEYRIFLTRSARDAFVQMARAAVRDSIELIVRSGYRSARYQREIINRRMAEGKSFEDVIRFVAPPGYSKHETGNAVDLVAGHLKDVTFARSATYDWMRSHAPDFYFFETYPNDSTSDLPWEPWHWQYFKPPEAIRGDHDSLDPRP